MIFIVAKYRFKESLAAPKLVQVLVWTTNFDSYFFPNGLFEQDIEPYNLGLKPLKKKNLKHFDSTTSNQIFNTFLEILRHNNISDTSNAFNKFISLMLAKIVDENKAAKERDEEDRKQTFKP